MKCEQRREWFKEKEELRFFGDSCGRWKKKATRIVMCMGDYYDALVPVASRVPLRIYGILHRSATIICFEHAHPRQAVRSLKSTSKRCFAVAGSVRLLRNFRSSLFHFFPVPLHPCPSTPPPPAQQKTRQTNSRDAGSASLEIRFVAL